MSESTLFTQREITFYNNGVFATKSDAVVQEVPLTIFVNDSEVAATVCSPFAYEELGAGFLVTEGFIQQPADILDISFSPEAGSLNIKISNQLKEPGSYLRRHTAGYYVKSGPAAHESSPLNCIDSDTTYFPEHLLNIINTLEDNSATFRLTGGVHSAALADEAGIICMYEDIGRHNAVDKTLGYAFLNQIPTHNKCLLLSGRVASEILIKAVRAHIPVVLSRAAATGRTIDMAQALNVTVIGFARGHRFTIYTHPERVTA